MRGASLSNRIGSTMGVRGMHYQIAPYSQVKLVSCARGAIYDVIIDLSGIVYLQALAGLELTEDNGLMLYVPGDFAHGFQTLSDNAEVFHQMFASDAPETFTGSALERSSVRRVLARDGKSFHQPARSSLS